jgi:RNA polymerase sigma-70 factor (ECF subfamily)
MHLEQFRSEARFSTWLIRIALPEILQRDRLRWSSHLVSLDPPALCKFQGSEETASPYKRLERMEISNLLRKAIAELAEKYQALILLRDMQGVSITDAARLARPPQAGPLTVALASKPRPGADIIQSDDSAIVA